MRGRFAEAGGRRWERIPVGTRLVLAGDDFEQAVADGLAAAGLETLPGDLLFLSEKAVGASQGRYHLLAEIRPRRLAVLLSRRVTRTPAGIGLGMPETMECALREVGTPRILLAAAVSAVTRLLGRRGDFYRIAGPLARSIDGPTRGTIPPFDGAVSLAPLDPEGVARRFADRFGCAAAVVDINDLGGNILGCWPRDLDRRTILAALSDNPLGQGREGTPAGILREAGSVPVAPVAPPAHERRRDGHDDGGEDRPPEAGDVEAPHE